MSRAIMRGPAETCDYCGVVSPDVDLVSREFYVCLDKRSCDERVDQARRADGHRRHYHLDDYPKTLAVLAAVAGNRDLSIIGYEPGEFGAEVDWDALTSSWLSSTEKAAVHIALGVALAERSGGLPPHLAVAVLAAAGDTRVVEP